MKFYALVSEARTHEVDLPDANAEQLSEVEVDGKRVELVVVAQLSDELVLRVDGRRYSFRFQENDSGCDKSGMTNQDEIRAIIQGHATRGDIYSHDEGAEFDKAEAIIQLESLGKLALPAVPALEQLLDEHSTVTSFSYCISNLVT